MDLNSIQRHKGYVDKFSKLKKDLEDGKKIFSYGRFMDAEKHDDTTPLKVPADLEKEFKEGMIMTLGNAIRKSKDVLNKELSSGLELYKE